jgi:ppGpp synthetase/RelA/SpoT-type nucleotidyltranferase
MTKSDLPDTLVELYLQRRHDIRIFMEGVVRFIGEHPELNPPCRAVVHSYKSRLKDPTNLRNKIVRKINEDRIITADNLFREITDLAGVRVLHLFQDGFRHIDAVIRKRLADGDWILSERPKVYTWDPENIEFFQNFDLDISTKDTSYTSVHYLIRPRNDSPICCEVQVRTLFEEIWGEVDHQINYPTPTNDVACREQIKVLSTIVGAGSRLLDSLQRVQIDNITNDD